MPSARARSMRSSLLNFGALPILYRLGAKQGRVGMQPRYIVRRLDGDAGYSVWDNEKNAVAASDFRTCANLGFDDAFNTAGRLNAESAPGTKPVS